MTVHHFSDTALVPASAEEIFDYYADVNNLLKMILPQLHMRLVKGDLPLREGSRVEFEVGPKSLPFSFPWVSKIVAFERPYRFEDRMISGPFAHWIHRHSFREVGDGTTEVHDEIEVARPAGLIGRMMMNEGDLAGRIKSLFDYRRKVLEERFGVPPSTDAP